MAIIDVRDILGSDVAEKGQIIVIGVPSSFRYRGTTNRTDSLISQKTALVIDEYTGLPALEAFERKMAFSAYTRYMRGATGALLTDIGDYKLGPSTYPAKPFLKAFEGYRDEVIKTQRDNLGPTSSSKETGRPNALRVIDTKIELPFELGTVLPYENGTSLPVGGKNYYVFFAVISEDFQEPVRKSVVQTALEHFSNIIINNPEQTAGLGIIVLPLGCEGGGLEYTYDPNSPETSGIHNLIVETLETLPNNVYVFEESSNPSSTTGIGGILEDDISLGLSNRAIYEERRQQAIYKAEARLYAQAAFREKYVPAFADSDVIEANKQAELEKLKKRRAVNLFKTEHDQKIARIEQEEIARKTPEYQSTQIKKCLSTIEEQRALKEEATALDAALSEARARLADDQRALSTFTSYASSKKETRGGQEFIAVSEEHMKIAKEAAQSEDKLRFLKSKLGMRLSEKERAKTLEAIEAEKTKSAKLDKELRKLDAKLARTTAEIGGYAGSVKERIAKEIQETEDEKAKLEKEKANLTEYSPRYLEIEEKIDIEIDPKISRLKRAASINPDELIDKSVALVRNISELERRRVVVKYNPSAEDLAELWLKKYSAPDFLTNPKVRTPEYTNAKKDADQAADAAAKQAAEASEAAYKSGAILDADRSIPEEEYETRRKNIEAMADAYATRPIELSDYVKIVEAQFREALLKSKPEGVRTLTGIEQSNLEDKINAAKKAAQAFINDVYNSRLKELKGVSDTSDGSKQAKLFNVLGVSLTEYNDVYDRMTDTSLPDEERAKAALRWKKLGKRKQQAIALGKKPIETFTGALREFGRMLEAFETLDTKVEEYLSLRDCPEDKKSDKIAEMTREIENDLTEKAAGDLVEAQEALKQENTTENMQKLVKAEEATKASSIKSAAKRRVEEIQDMTVMGAAPADGKKSNKKALFEAYNASLNSLIVQANFVVGQLNASRPFINSELANFYNIREVIENIDALWSAVQVQTQAQDITEVKAYASKLKALSGQLSKLTSGFDAVTDFAGYELIMDANPPLCLFADESKLNELAESLFSAKKIAEINSDAQREIANRGYALKGTVKALKAAVLADKVLVRKLAIVKILSQLAAYIDQDGVREIANDDRMEFSKFLKGSKDSTGYETQLKSALSGNSGAIRYFENTGSPVTYGRFVKKNTPHSAQDIVDLAEVYETTAAGQDFLAGVFGGIGSEAKELDNGLAYAIIKIGLDDELKGEPEEARDTLKRLFETYYVEALNRKKAKELNTLIEELKELQKKERAALGLSGRSAGLNLPSLQREKSSLEELLRKKEFDAAIICEQKKRPPMTADELKTLEEDLSKLDISELTRLRGRLPKTPRDLEQERSIKARIAALAIDIDQASKSRSASGYSIAAEINAVSKKLKSIELKINGLNRYTKLKSPYKIATLAKALVPVRQCAAAVAYTSAKAAYARNLRLNVQTSNVAGTSGNTYQAYVDSTGHLIDFGNDSSALVKVEKALQKAAAIERSIEIFESQIGEELATRIGSRGYVVEDDKLGMSASKFRRDEAQYERLKNINMLAKQVGKTLGIIAFDADSVSGFKARREDDIKVVEAAVKEIRAYRNALKMTLIQDPDAPFDTFTVKRGDKGEIYVDYVQYDPQNGQSTEARAAKLEDLIAAASDYLDERESALARLKRKRIRRRKGGVLVATEDQRQIMENALLAGAAAQAHSELLPAFNNADVLEKYLNYLIFSAPLSGDQRILKPVKSTYAGDERIDLVPDARSISDEDRAKEIVDLSNRAIEDIARLRGADIVKTYAAQAKTRVAAYLGGYLRKTEALDTEQPLRVLSIKGTSDRPEIVVSEEIIESAADRKTRIQQIVRDLNSSLSALEFDQKQADIKNKPQYLAYLRSDAANDTSKPLLVRNSKTGKITRRSVTDPGVRAEQVRKLIEDTRADVAVESFANKIEGAAAAVSRAINKYDLSYLRQAIRSQDGRLELREAVEKMGSQIKKIGTGKGSGTVAGPKGFSAAIRGALEESLGYKELLTAPVPTLEANQTRDELVSQLNGEINALVSQLAQDYLPTIENALLSFRTSNPAKEDDPIQSVLSRLSVKPEPLSLEKYMLRERSAPDYITKRFVEGVIRRSIQKLADTLLSSESSLPEVERALRRAEDDTAKAKSLLIDGYAGKLYSFPGALDLVVKYKAVIGGEETELEKILSPSERRERVEKANEKIEKANEKIRKENESRRKAGKEEEAEEAELPESLIRALLDLIDSEETALSEYLGGDAYSSYLASEKNRFTLSTAALDALKAVVAKCAELEAFIRGGDSASSYGDVLAGQALAVSESDAKVRFRTGIGAKLEEVVSKRGKAITKLTSKFEQLKIAIFGASEVGSHVAEITENSEEIEKIKAQLEAGETDRRLTTELQYLTATNRELEVDAAIYEQLNLYVNALFDRAEEVYDKEDILIIVGMTEGFSQLVAETAKSRGIPVRAEVPYRKESTGNPYQDRVWGKESQLPQDNRAAYYAILEYAEETGGVYYTAETRPADYQVVNGQAMVDLADVVWIYPGDVKGLSAIEQYAKKKGVGVYELPVEVSKLTRSGGDKRKDKIAFRRSEGAYAKWAAFYNAENRAGLTVVTVDYYETLIKWLANLFAQIQGKLISRDKALAYLRDQTGLPYVLPNGQPDYSALEKYPGLLPGGTAKLNQDLETLADKFFASGGAHYCRLVAAEDAILFLVKQYNRNNGTEYTVKTIASLPADQLPAQIASLLEDMKVAELPLGNLAKIKEDAANSESATARAGRAPEALLRQQKAAMVPSKAPSAAEATSTERNAKLRGLLEDYLKYLGGREASYLSAPLKCLKFDRDDRSENLQVYISPLTGKPVVVSQDIPDANDRRIRIERLRKNTKEVLDSLKPVYADLDYTGPVGGLPKHKQQEEMLLRGLDEARKSPLNLKLENIAELGAGKIRQINKLYLDLSALPGEERGGFAQEKVVELAGKEGLQRRRRPVGRPGRRSNPESTPISVFATELGIDFDPSLYSASQDSCRHCATSLLYLQREIDPSLDISDALHDLSSDDANSVLCNRIARETARLVRSAYRSGSQSATRKISSLVARTMEDCEGRG